MTSQRVASGSATDNYWCGTNVLAPLFGTDGGAAQGVVNRIGKMLTCPSNVRPKNPATGFSVDDPYNGNMGDDRAYPLEGIRNSERSVVREP